MIIFKIGQYWDEGIGFDYENQSYDFVSGNRTYDERPSNWFYRNTMSTWSTSGIYNEFPSIISGYTGGKIHFDNRDEWLLVEAKGHIGEINSDCGATNPTSKQKIFTALEKASQAFGNQSKPVDSCNRHDTV